MMKKQELRALWQVEEQAAFNGWDFSHLDSRWQEEPLPWDYRALVQAHLQPSHRLLDVGTGGGEFLLSLHHPYENTCVTEGWGPNIALCKETLAPLRIGVFAVRDDRLPFENGLFDLVINRQSSYDLEEVSRVLKPGGIFITQQVGGQNCTDRAGRLCPHSPPPQPGFSLSGELPKFQHCGFEVQYSFEAHPLLRFFDVGAVVYWAKAIPWSFPHFSVKNNFQQLCCLQEELTRNGCVRTLQHRFVIVAQNKPLRRSWPDV